MDKKPTGLRILILWWFFSGIFTLLGTILHFFIGTVVQLLFYAVYTIVYLGGCYGLYKLNDTVRKVIITLSTIVFIWFVWDTSHFMLQYYPFLKLDTAITLVLLLRFYHIFILVLTPLYLTKREIVYLFKTKGKETLVIEKIES